MDLLLLFDSLSVWLALFLNLHFSLLGQFLALIELDLNLLSFLLLHCHPLGFFFGDSLSFHLFLLLGNSSQVLSLCGFLFFLLQFLLLGHPFFLLLLESCLEVFGTLLLGFSGDLSSLLNLDFGFKVSLSNLLGLFEKSVSLGSLQFSFFLNLGFKLMGELSLKFGLFDGMLLVHDFLVNFLLHVQLVYEIIIDINFILRLHVVLILLVVLRFKFFIENFLILLLILFDLLDQVLNFLWHFGRFILINKMIYFIITVLCSNELVTIFDILLPCLFRNLIEVVKFSLDMCLELLLFFNEFILSGIFLLHLRSFVRILGCEKLFIFLWCFFDFLDLFFFVFEFTESFIFFGDFAFNFFLNMRDCILLLGIGDFLWLLLLGSFLNNLLWLSFFVLIKIRISIIIRLLFLLFHVVGLSLSSFVVALFLSLSFLFFLGNLLFIFVDYVILIYLALLYFLWSLFSDRGLLNLLLFLGCFVFAEFFRLLLFPSGESSLEFMMLLRVFFFDRHHFFVGIFGCS